MKKLKKLILALTIAGAISCDTKKSYDESYSNLEYESGRPPMTKLLDENYKIQMRQDDGGKLSKYLNIKSFLSPEGNALYFRNYTQDYDRVYEEKEKIPMILRYTKLNSEWSEIYLIHSKKVAISDINQTAYFVPQHEWNELKPYEEHKEAQQLVKGSEKLLDWTLGKIPFSEDVLNIILKKAEKTKQKYYSELLKKTNKNYVIEKIPAHIPTKLFSHTETAREYEITFDLENLNESSETYLIENIFLGDPSESSGNSFQNKRGELENILIKFILKPVESAEKNEPELAKNKEDKTKTPAFKNFSVCINYIDHQYGKRADGKSDIEEIIFYIRKENSGWKEFDKSQDVCANKQVILENPNSFIDIKATGKFGNGRGNGWFFHYAPQGKRISWNSEEKIILEY